MIRDVINCVTELQGTTIVGGKSKIIHWKLVMECNKERVEAWKRDLITVGLRTNFARVCARLGILYV